MSDLVNLLNERVQVGDDHLHRLKYELVNKATFHFSLEKMDISFVQQLVHMMKHYGMKVQYGDPNLESVKKDAIAGRLTFVVISNNLLELSSNSLFLEQIGMSHLLNQQEKE